MLLGLILQVVTAFTPIPDSLPHLLNGHFVSCNDADDEGYGELAFEYQQNGRVRWRLDMGPRSEFALFVPPYTSEHLAHDNAHNLLKPAFNYDDVQTRTGRNWSVAGLHIDIIRVPARDESCYAFLVRITAESVGKWAVR